MSDYFSGAGTAVLTGGLNFLAGQQAQKTAYAETAKGYRRRYQDTMADMSKAGLNPILAYGGVGGSFPQASPIASAGFPSVATSAKELSEVPVNKQRVYEVATRTQMTAIQREWWRENVDMIWTQHAQEEVRYEMLLEALKGARIEGIFDDNDFGRITRGLRRAWPGSGFPDINVR